LQTLLDNRGVDIDPNQPRNTRGKHISKRAPKWPAWIIAGWSVLACRLANKSAFMSLVTGSSQYRPTQTRGDMLPGGTHCLLLTLPKTAAPIRMPMPKATPSVSSGRASTSVLTRATASLP